MVWKLHFCVVQTTQNPNALGMCGTDRGGGWLAGLTGDRRAGGLAGMAGRISNFWAEGSTNSPSPPSPSLPPFSSSCHLRGGHPTLLAFGA